MKKQRKKGSGGARIGAGRKNKFNEECKYIQILTPISQIENVKDLVNEYLNNYKNGKLQQIH